MVEPASNSEGMLAKNIQVPPRDSKKMRMMTEKELCSTPDLQLSLRSNSVFDHGGNEKILKGRETEEFNSLLSLSLSPPTSVQQEKHTKPDDVHLSLEIGSSSKKLSALGLSTLDLTMSIRAAE